MNPLLDQLWGKGQWPYEALDLVGSFLVVGDNELANFLFGPLELDVQPLEALKGQLDNAFRTVTLLLDDGEVSGEGAFDEELSSPAKQIIEFGA